MNEEKKTSQSRYTQILKSLPAYEILSRTDRKQIVSYLSFRTPLKPSDMPKNKRNKHKASKQPEAQATSSRAAEHPDHNRPREASTPRPSTAEARGESHSQNRSPSSKNRQSSQDRLSSSSKNQKTSQERERGSSSQRPEPRDSSGDMVDKMKGLTITASGHSSTSLIKPMSRPGYGTAGRPITLEANFFRLRLPSGLVASQYAVSVLQKKHPSEMNSKKGKRSQIPKPEFEAEKKWVDTATAEPVFFNRAVFAKLLAVYGSEIGTHIAYDGRSIAYGPKRALNPQSLGHEYRLTVNREGGELTEDEKRNNKGIEVKVRIDHAKDLKFDDVLKRKIGSLASVEFLAALDNVLAHSPRTKYVQVGRSFYSPQDATPLSRGSNATVSAWRGFYQSARLSEAGLLVNLDESFTTFWNMGGRPLMELIREANDGRDPWSDHRALSVVASKLKALKVRAVHNGITYKVHGFSRRSADHESFEDDRGRRVTVSDYFAESYGRRLRYGNLPCVKTNPKRETYLPVEVLMVVEKQRMMGLLTPDMTAVMVRRASTRPNDKKQTALSTIRGLGLDNDPLCRDFGLKVEERLMKVNARVLPPPPMMFSRGRGNRRELIPSRVNAGQWRPSANLYAPALLKSWAVIVEGNCVDQNLLHRFLKELAHSGGRVGLDVSQPALYSARFKEGAEVMKTVVQEFRAMRLKNKETMPLQLIMVVRNSQDAPSYNKIKAVGEIEFGLPSQVIFARNLRNPRGLNMYCDNVILKINAKLGGQNSYVGAYRDSGLPVPDVPFITIPHIILGADVTHPMPGGRTPSVAALVGSRDREGIQYSAAIRNQPSRQEVIADLGEMFKEVYNHWLNNFGNKVHTKRIIMFRDGVSEGQFEKVMTDEVHSLRKACREIAPGCNPLITYIIVTKRHHTKLFPNRGDGDRNGNVLPGTVVDRDIVSNEFYDFYVNSHAGIQGTNKPSKYTVLVDESKLPVDVLQGFVYRLAHGFARCNRSVSMVNSAYYAHLLAFRGRAYLGEEQSDTASTASLERVPAAPRLDQVLARRLFFV